MIRAKEINANKYSIGVINAVTVLIMLIISYEDIFNNYHRKLYMIRLAKISCIIQFFFFD